jgi:hypothetical protein
VRRNHRRNSTKIGEFRNGITGVISPHVEMTINRKALCKKGLFCF